MVLGVVLLCLLLQLSVTECFISTSTTQMPTHQHPTTNIMKQKQHLSSIRHNKAHMNIHAPYKTASRTPLTLRAEESDGPDGPDGRSGSDSNQKPPPAPPAVPNFRPQSSSLAKKGSLTKRLKSQEPDVIVAVGSGAAMQEFDSYRVVLGLASDYLDEKLNDAWRVEFPDKDPQQWKLVYEFINPTTMRAAEITNDNVIMLVPWFHELQMHKLKEECDAIIASDDVFQDCVQVKGEYPFRTHCKGWKSEGRKELRKNLFQYYSMCELYSLPKSTSKAIAEIEFLMKEGYDLLEDMEVVKQVIVLVKKHMNSMDTSLWDGFRAFLPPALAASEEPLDNVMNNDLLPHLFQSGVQMKIQSKKYNDQIMEQKGSTMKGD